MSFTSRSTSHSRWRRSRPLLSATSSRPPNERSARTPGPCGPLEPRHRAPRDAMGRGRRARATVRVVRPAVAAGHAGPLRRRRDRARRRRDRPDGASRPRVEPERRDSRRCRTPMIWEPGDGRGFTRPGGEPWLPFGGARGSVEEQRTDRVPSCWCRRVIALRRSTRDLAMGDQQVLGTDERSAGLAPRCRHDGGREPVRETGVRSGARRRCLARLARRAASWVLRAAAALGVRRGGERGPIRLTVGGHDARAIRHRHRRSGPQRPGRGVLPRPRRPAHGRARAAADLGGACTTEEFAPGFKASPGAYVLSMLRGAVWRDLRLRARADGRRGRSVPLNLLPRRQHVRARRGSPQGARCDPWPFGGRRTGITAYEQKLARIAASLMGDPKRTFLGLVDGAALPAEFSARLAAYRCEGASLKMNLAVAELPRIAGVDGGPGIHPYHRGLVQLTKPLLELGPRPGGGSRRPSTPSTRTSSSAFRRSTTRRWPPEGRHVVTLGVRSQPYRLNQRQRRTRSATRSPTG